ncbi:MAG: hypothetical protein IJC25_00580, partial [Clostridia bacterium]|nr:hypothetical protein [Clostridia bacterium]
NIEKKITGQGSFKARATHSLSFPISGVIAENNITSYGSVKKGELLVVLEEAETLKLDLSKAERNVIVYKAEVDRLKAEVEGGGQIALLKLQWDQEAFTLANMSAEATATEKSAQQIKTDIAKAAYETALAQAQTNYTVALADYEASVAERDLKKDRYEDCFIYAPVSGVITWIDSKAGVGSKVSAYADVLTISEGTDVYLSYSGEKSSIPHMGVGTELQIVYKNVTYDAKVIQDPDTTPPDAFYGAPFVWFFDVPELDLTNVKIGDTATFTIILDKRENVLVLDSYLISTVNGADTVKVLVDGFPISRPVEVGLAGITQVEIISGLQEGDEVIIS